jgi:hypothetical protein
MPRKNQQETWHTGLSNVCGSAAFDRSTFRSWTKKRRLPKQGMHSYKDLPRSGRTVTAVSPEMLQHDDAIVHEDRRITI